jgi:hypothetical protein
VFVGVGFASQKQAVLVFEGERGRAAKEAAALLPF